MRKNDRASKRRRLRQKNKKEPNSADDSNGFSSDSAPDKILMSQSSHSDTSVKIRLKEEKAEKQKW